MKAKKTGYTLAEVLISVGIIGVIAALTIPAIKNSVKERTVTPSKERAVNVLRHGMANIIYNAQANSENTGAVTTIAAITQNDVLENHVNTLLTTDNALFGNNMRSFLGIEALDADKSEEYLDSVNGIPENVAYLVYRIKKGKAYVIVTPIPAINANIADDGVITDIYIDADGEKGSNTLNEDIFAYTLLNNGHINEQ